MTPLEKAFVTKYRNALRALKARVYAAAERAQSMDDETLAQEVGASSWPRPGEAEESPGTWLDGPLRAMHGALRDLSVVRLVHYTKLEESQRGDGSDDQ